MREVGTTGPGAGETVSGTFEGGRVQLDQVCEWAARENVEEGMQMHRDRERERESLTQTQPRRNAEASLGRVNGRWYVAVDDASRLAATVASIPTLVHLPSYAGKPTPR